MAIEPSKVNLLSRLDRIPMTRTVILLIGLLSLVWLAEAFDIGVIGPVLTQLEKAWNLPAWKTGLLAISSTIGIVVGMIPSGILADKFGRRTVMLLGIPFFSILTLLGFFVSGFWSLFFVRLLAGVGEGAVLPMPYLFLAEFVHSHKRAVSVGYSNGILTAAYTLPSLVAVWALHAYDPNIAWRVPFLLGGIPLLMTIPLYLWLPESPRYLLKRNRVEPVRKLVERLENEAGLGHDVMLLDERVTLPLQLTRVRQATQPLGRKVLLVRLVTVILQLTAALMLFYIVQVFGPSLLIHRGFGTSDSILYAGVMMLIAGVGSIVQGYLADRFGRKTILGLYVTMASIGCLVFAFTILLSWTIVAGLLTSFFGLGIFPISKLCVAKQFPTDARGRYVYTTEMVARGVSGIVTVYFIPFVLNAQGSNFIFVAIAVTMIVLNIPFLLLARETANVDIEHASSISHLRVVRSGRAS